MEAQEVIESQPFSRSRQEFEGILEQLATVKAMSITHAELEELVDNRGTKLLCSLIQDHLDLRGPGKVQEAVVGADGLERRQVRFNSRGLMTIVGRVEVERAGYARPGEETLYPLDGQLNLPQELYSFGVRKRVAIEAAKSSFREAVQTLTDMTGAKLGVRQAEELVCRSAQDFAGFYEQRQAESGQSSRETGEILVLSTDGKGVVMRHQDLREATRLAAEQRSHKMTKRLSKGEKRNSKRMATVAAVYTVKPHVRRPEDIVAELRGIQDLEKKKQRPRPEQKRVWASVEKKPEEVIEAAFNEALHRDPAGKKSWVVVVDGAEVQLDLLIRKAAEYAVDITVVLDLIHVIEYLWKAVTAFHSEGTREAQDWVTERIVHILRGQASNVAAGMRRSATLRELKPEERNGVDTCADYLLKYSAYMRYDDYLKRGFPIASGVIEGACRHLIKDRLDITGARWSLAGAEAVLRLRSLRSSGDFDDYWAHHVAQELSRNHTSRYQEAKMPIPVPYKSRTDPQPLRLLH
jgi:hypothetical protein